MDWLGAELGTDSEACASDGTWLGQRFRRPVPTSVRRLTESFERCPIWDQPACTSSGCPSHLSLQFGSTRVGEAEITVRCLCAKNQVSSLAVLRILRHPVQREKRRPTQSLVAENRVKLGIRAAACALSGHGDLLFARSFLLHVSLLPESQNSPF